MLVTINGQHWDVTTWEGSYDQGRVLFATNTNGGAMPWWGNQSLALDVCLQVGVGLGEFPANDSGGPFFGWAPPAPGSPDVIYYNDRLPVDPLTPTYPGQPLEAPTATPFVWAVAFPVS